MFDVIYFMCRHHQQVDPSIPAARYCARSGERTLVDQHVARAGNGPCDVLVCGKRDSSMDQGTELALAEVLASGLRRGNHFADAALRVALEERPDVLSHPRPADLARDAIRIFRRGELEHQDQVSLVNLRDPSRERTRIDDKLHPLGGCPHGHVGQRVTEAEMVDHDVHEVDPIVPRVVLLRRHSATLAQPVRLLARPAAT